MRASRDARWQPVTWRRVIPDLAKRLRSIVDEHGPDAVMFYVSGQLLTEDYYVVNKLVKGFVGTNNVDSNSRLCMSSAVAAYKATFGSDGPPGCYADIDQADCMLLLGTNTAACHPIVWSRIRRRQQEGAQLIVIDPRRTRTAEAADLHLPVRPGGDLALLNSMINVIVRDGLVDETFVAVRTEGAEQAIAAAEEWTPERAAEETGVPAEAIVEAARCFAGATRSLALWSMGANQSSVGTLKNRALHNLCLLTGNFGRPGTGPLSLTGQPNAMGGRETGGLANLLPGYRSVTVAEDRAAMRKLWGLPADLPGISPEPGIASTELADALHDGRVKAVWVVATNPVVSQPDAERFAAGLERGGAGGLPGRLPPDRDRGARPLRAARGGVAREGRRHDELGTRCLARPASASCSGARAARLGDLRPPRPCARPRRRVRVAVGVGGLRRVRRHDRGPAVRRHRHLATSGSGGRACCSGHALPAVRARPPTRARHGCTARAACRPQVAGRGWRRLRTPRPPTAPTTITRCS